MRRALPIALAICLLSGLILSVGVRTSAAATANAGYVGPEFGATPAATRLPISRRASCGTTTATGGR